MQYILFGNSLNGTNWNLAIARVSGSDIDEVYNYAEVNVARRSLYVITFLNNIYLDNLTK